MDARSTKRKISEYSLVFSYFSYLVTTEQHIKSINKILDIILNKLSLLPDKQHEIKLNFH